MIVALDSFCTIVEHTGRSDVQHNTGGSQSTHRKGFPDPILAFIGKSRKETVIASSVYGIRIIHHEK